MDRRVSYEKGELNESSAQRDPFAQFGLWFAAAVDAGFYEPAAMTLATATREGRPSARIVLLRGYDERGFLFFTNYQSRKGSDLEHNAQAALAFYWDVLERQVRIEGEVEVVEAQESDAYFAQRPRGHQLSAWASEQSRIVPDRASQEERMRRYEERFVDRPVERPPHWGGYRVRPVSFEFWQGRLNRIHDRVVYTRNGEAWNLARLAP